MQYNIEQNADDTYTIAFVNGLRLAICPCCDKPLLDRGKALILAENILALDEGNRRRLFPNVNF